MDHAAVGMCLLNPEGRVEDVNNALCQFLGYDAEHAAPEDLAGGGPTRSTWRKT